MPTEEEVNEPSEQGDEDQEVLQPLSQALDSSTIALLSKSEIDTQIATAKKYPRQIAKLLSTAIALVTADAEAADEAIYALPRAGKIIEGPSVRFAEVMAYSWGNCRCGARVISEDEEFITAMGSFIDLEMNVAIGYEVKRRITTREGKRFNVDIIQQTANAACSIALRNAVLRGIPKALWKKVYNAARQAVAGDTKTLDARVAQMFKSFELMGVKRDQVFAKLGIKGVEDITLDHLVSLRGIFNAIRENEITAARAFAITDAQDTNLADKSKANLEEIKKKYAGAGETGPAGGGPIEVGPLRAAPQPQAVDKPVANESPKPEPVREPVPVPQAPVPEPEPAAAEPGAAPTASGPDDHGIPLKFE
jgi:hypothetical protein